MRPILSQSLPITLKSIVYRPVTLTVKVRGVHSQVERIEGKISVVLPIGSWRVSTATAIDSILNQSYQNLELLLIGQPDLQKLRQGLAIGGIKDHRIRLIARTKPGIVNALNSALEAATGQYIARMDDDDVAYKHRLQTQFDFLQQHQNIKLCAAKVRMIGIDGTEQGVTNGNRSYVNWLNALTQADSIARACYAENPMPHPTLFAHHTVFDNLAGYRDCEGPEDHDLILRAMLSGISMGKPEPVLLDWREHPQRLTRTAPRYARRAFIKGAASALINKGGPLRVAASDGNSMRGVWIAGTGICACHWHDELASLSVHVHGFVDMTRPGPDRQKRKRPVITYEQLCNNRGNALLISALTTPSAKNAIRDFCNEMQWIEGHDFIMRA